ncbi:nucleophile aminohydrolase [Scleroderma citrinum]
MSYPTVYVAVHAGAGNHGRTSEHSVKLVMKRACMEALRLASPAGVDVLSIVERAIVELEDDHDLNAGSGSNLTLDGAVECDAAIMDGRTGDFGSVGAVSEGVKNPIKLASAILDQSRKPDRLGRIRPLTLVSSGAHSFAIKKRLETVPPESMISSRASMDWCKWVERHNKAGEAETPELEAIPEDVPQDTIGAVAWDNCGNVAAGVSSGGLLLKDSGRVGQAAIFGTGCWAQQSSDGQAGMACSISGSGEHIIRAGLARAIGDALQVAKNPGGAEEADVDVHDVLITTLTEQFCRPANERGVSHADVGVLLLTKEAQEGGCAIPRLWCAFTATSMAIAYASSRKPIPKAMVLRRPQTASRSNLSETQPVYITALRLHE